jgi:hypothetical protein
MDSLSVPHAKLYCIYTVAGCVLALLVRIFSFSYDSDTEAADTKPTRLNLKNTISCLVYIFQEKREKYTEKYRKMMHFDWKSELKRSRISK